jgi:hypothetical protein
LIPLFVCNGDASAKARVFREKTGLLTGAPGKLEPACPASFADLCTGFRDES